MSVYDYDFQTSMYTGLYNDVLDFNTYYTDTASDPFAPALIMLCAERLRKAGKTLSVTRSYQTYYGPAKVDWNITGNMKNMVCVLETDRRVVDPKIHAPQVQKGFVSQTGQMGYNFTPIGALNIFLKQHNIHAQCFHDMVACVTVILIQEGMVDHRDEVLAGLVPFLVPWLFENDPLTCEEQELLKALTKQDQSLVVTHWSRYVTQHDGKKLWLKEQLKGFTGSDLTKRLEELNGAISYNEERMRSMMDELARSIQDHDRALGEREVVQRQIANSEEVDVELYDFLCANMKQIRVLNVKSTEGSRGLLIEVCTYLDQIDEDKYVHYIERGCSPLVKIAHFSSVEWERFWKAVWIERRFKLRTSALYFIFGNAKLTPSTYCVSTTTVPEDRIPNPHINDYNCLGAYADFSAQMMLQKNHVGALSVALSATKNLNLADGVVTERFARSLANRLFTERIVETRDGSCITIAEAIEQLNKEAADENV